MITLLLAQARSLFPLLVKVFFPAVVLLVCVLLMSETLDIPMHYFIADPAALASMHPLMGVLSNLGVILWSGTAAVCFFAAAVRRDDGTRGLTAYFFWGGALTTVLLADDLFMIHDDLVKRYLGLPEKAVLAGYLIATSGYLVRFRQWIRKTDFLLLLLALGLFSSSVVFDQLLPHDFKWNSFLDDGPKLLGIIAWLTYFSRTALQNLESSTANRS